MQNPTIGYNNDNPETDIPAANVPTLRLRLDSNEAESQNLPAMQEPQLERTADIRALPGAVTGLTSADYQEMYPGAVARMRAIGLEVSA